MFNLKYYLKKLKIRPASKAGYKYCYTIDKKICEGCLKD